MLTVPMPVLQAWEVRGPGQLPRQHPGNILHAVRPLAGGFKVRIVSHNHVSRLSTSICSLYHIISQRPPHLLARSKLIT